MTLCINENTYPMMEPTYTYNSICINKHHLNLDKVILHVEYEDADNLEMFEEIKMNNISGAVGGIINKNMLKHIKLINNEISIRDLFHIHCCCFDYDGVQLSLTRNDKDYKYKKVYVKILN